MKQLKVGLTDAQRAHLETVASISGHSVSEEIRRRLDRSIAEDQFDFRSREIGNDVMWIASMLQQKLGWGPRLSSNWDDDARMNEALSIAITTWLEAKKPPPRPDSDAAANLFDPKTLGLAAANNYAMLKAEQQKHYQADEKHRGDIALEQFIATAKQMQMKATKKKGKP